MTAANAARERCEIDKFMFIIGHPVEAFQCDAMRI